MTGSRSVSSRSLTGRPRIWAAWLVLTLFAALLTQATGDRARRLVFDGWQRTAPRDLSRSDVRIVMIFERLGHKSSDHGLIRQMVTGSFDGKATCRSAFFADVAT